MSQPYFLVEPSDAKTFHLLGKKQDAIAAKCQEHNSCDHAYFTRALIGLYESRDIAAKNFEKVIVAHGVRQKSDLAYARFISEDLPNHELLGDVVRDKLIYHPTVTREPFRIQGRITDQLADGSLASRVGLPPLNPADDRFMLCGSPAMLEDTRRLLDERGFQISPRIGEPGDYVIERAFVEK